MANPPPPYPNELTRNYWNTKKGLFAKTTETGIGQAADAAEAAYDKILWKAFDTDAMAPTGAARQNPKYFESLELLIKKEHKDHVLPTITALQHLSSTAKGAVPGLTQKLLKDAATVATDIGTKADHLAIALKDNSVFFTNVKNSLTQLEAINEKILAAIAENAAKTKEFLKQLLIGLNEIKADANPTDSVWDVKVKQQGRNVCNSIKTNPKIQQHLGTWTTKFQGFDWGTLGFSQLHGDELKSKVNHFASEVFAEAKNLSHDLG